MSFDEDDIREVMEWNGCSFNEAVAILSRREERQDDGDGEFSDADYDSPY